MQIYVGHSRNFDFEQELYAPLKAAKTLREHSLIFPHRDSSEPFHSKQFFQSGCDLVIAEVSFPSTGLGIELGWADDMDIPIIAVYRSGTNPSSSISVVAEKVLEYVDCADLVSQLEALVHELCTGSE